MEIVPVEDDHSVQVSLKDMSIYSYLPRPISYQQRIEIRAITDDLLARNIIKSSTSPCARIVPVRKRNGSLRLCVDLRPFNQRVNKQRCPFPLVKDCLTRLKNKSVFTTLHLKEGFHNIKIYPDHTHYFSFATLDGQFEFNRLPFGYCEAPAEFYKCLMYILQPYIRCDLVITYMDDILIALRPLLKKIYNS